MVIFEMKWNERFVDSGWVAEIQGFETTRKFKSEFLLPLGGKYKACKKRLAIFHLEEGKVYMIENTGDDAYFYAKVINGNVMTISKDGVNEHLIQTGHKSLNAEMNFKTNTTNNKHTSNNTNNDSKLCKEINFILSTLEEAFTTLRVKNEQGLFKTMVSAASKYAEIHGFTKECLHIYKALSRGESTYDIKMNF